MKYLLTTFCLLFMMTGFGQFKMSEYPPIINSDKGSLDSSAIFLVSQTKSGGGLKTFKTSVGDLRKHIDTSLFQNSWKLNGNGNTDTSNFIGTTDAKDLVFKTKGVEAMRVDTNGNVGIGAVAPAYNLNINGSAQIVNRPNGLSVINTIGIGDGNYFPYLLSQDTASLINNQVYLDPVGLGTSILTHGVSLVAIYNGSTYTALKVDTGDMLFFQGSNPGAPDTVMSLKGAKFGIGTATPTSKLHVYGDVRIEGTDSVTIYALTPAEGTFQYCTDCTGNGITGRLLGYIGSAWRRFTME